MANRCGLNWDYKNVSDVYTEMASTMSSLNNISWERLEKDGAVCYPVDNETSLEMKYYFQGFPTSNGKAKIVPADLMPQMKNLIKNITLF